MMFPIAQRSGAVHTCRGCGCDDNHACVMETRVTGAGGSLTHQQPCWWVLIDVDTPTGVCSQCAIDVEWDQEALAFVGRDERGIPNCLKQPRRLLG